MSSLWFYTSKKNLQNYFASIWWKSHFASYIKPRIIILKYNLKALVVLEVSFTPKPMLYLSTKNTYPSHFIKMDRGIYISCGLHQWSWQTVVVFWIILLGKMNILLAVLSRSCPEIFFSSLWLIFHCFEFLYRRNQYNINYCFSKKNILNILLLF